MNEHTDPDLIKPGTKKKMSHRDFTGHIAQAGAEARKAAANKPPAGGDASAVMDMDGFDIGGHTLQPLSLTVITALQKCGSAYMREGKDEQPAPLGMIDIAIGILCFADPIRAYQLAKSGDADAVELAALELGKHLTSDKLAVANEWINSQFASVADNSKKAPPPAK